MLEAPVAEVRGPAPAHLGPTRQRPRHPSIKMPSGQHGLWGHNAASRPPPLPRRRVALPRTAWCGALSAGRSSGSRIMARLRPSQAARLDETGCSVAHGGDGLPGYSGATAPELHRTSLDPHLLGAVFHGGVGFPLAVISQKSAPVGKLKSWRVEELKSPWTRCDLSNFPTSSEVSAQQL